LSDVTFKNIPTDISIFSTEYNTLNQVEFSNKASLVSLQNAVLASLAHPIYFHSIDIFGSAYIDGGIFNNIPMPNTVEAEQFDKIIVLLPGYTVTHTDQESHILHKLCSIVAKLRFNEFERDVAACGYKDKLVVLQPKIGYDVGLMELNKDLIGNAYAIGKHALTKYLRNLGE
jgi:predicted acylesterase/phospholipase RssA